MSAVITLSVGDGGNGKNHSNHEFYFLHCNCKHLFNHVVNLGILMSTWVVSA